MQLNLRNGMMHYLNGEIMSECIIIPYQLLVGIGIIWIISSFIIFAMYSKKILAKKDITLKEHMIMIYCISGFGIFILGLLVAIILLVEWVVLQLPCMVFKWV